ncbi:hypothetical protein FH972_019669 [Carpinus fangiana]|uniref:Uncharacterized protein n=1 Tax=Carpinus fangiana TaxID=176857 RepID=A0A5N6RTZ7_9ROSI|nr:hypothetical protein FH972_019669 [Carpinus fangiana]
MYRRRAYTALKHLPASKSTSHTFLISENTPPPGFVDKRKELQPTGAADEGRVSPPIGFANEQGFGAGIVLPPALGVSIRVLTDDLILLPSLSIRGTASRTHRSDRIIGICHTVPIKNTGLMHIDLTEDLGSESETVARRGPLTRGARGGAAIGGTARGGAGTGGAATDGVATGGAARDGAVRDGEARGGEARGRGITSVAGKGGGTAIMAGRGGANVSSSN